MRLLTKVTMGVLVAAIALAGCSAQAGAAAVVDGSRIPVTDVDAVTTELSPYFQAGPAAFLRILVVAPTYIAEAEAQGVAASPDDGAAWFEAQTGQPAGDFSDPTLQVLRFAQIVDSFNALPDAAELGEVIQERVAALDVEISPRYGTWDGVSSQIVASVPEWTVTPGSAQ